MVPAWFLALFHTRYTRPQASVATLGELASCVTFATSAPDHVFPWSADHTTPTPTVSPFASCTMAGSYSRCVVGSIAIFHVPSISPPFPNGACAQLWVGKVSP